VASIERCVSNGSSSSVTGARVRSMESALLCAAAIAAGVASSMAQSNVYSLNIVGYANVPTPHGYTFQSNPFEESPSDSAVNAIPNPNPTQGGSYLGPMDGSALQIWTGVGFSVADFDSETTDTTTGFTDAGGNPIPAPTLVSGLGYLINNQTLNGTTNITYVGTVRTGTNSLNFPVRQHPYAVGSPIPYSGGVSTGLGMVNPNPTQGGSYSGPADGSALEFLRVNGSGQAVGYTVVDFDSETTDTTTGFTDAGGNPVAEPQVPIGGGYFFVSASLNGAYTWTQILNP